MSQCPTLSEGNTEPIVAPTFRTCLAKGCLRYRRCARYKTHKYLVFVTQVGSQELMIRKSTRRSDRYLKYHCAPGATWAQGGLECQRNKAGGDAPIQCGGTRPGNQESRCSKSQAWKPLFQDRHFFSLSFPQRPLLLLSSK